MWSDYRNSCVVGMLLGALVIFSCDSAESKKGRFLLKGNGKMQEGDIQGAITFYEEALQVDEAFADAYYNRGLAYIRLANFPQAIADFNRAFEIQPTNYDVLYQRAIAHLDFGENYKALADADVLVNALPDDSRGYFIQGLTYTELAQHEIALDAFSQAIVLDPNNSDLLVNRATINYYQGNLSAAQEDLDAAKVLNAKEPNIYNLESLLAFETKAYEKALELVEKAIALNLNQPYYYNNRGLYQLFLGNLEKGLDDINYSLSQDNNNGYALRNKGLYHYFKGDFVQALSYLQEASAKNENLPLLVEYMEKVTTELKR